MWDWDDSLKQVDLSLVEGISTVYDCIELSEDEKDVMVEGRDASTVTIICNRYPAPEVSWQVIPVGAHSLGQVVQLKVRMEVEYEDDNLQVPSLHSSHQSF